MAKKPIDPSPDAPPPPRTISVIERRLKSGSVFSAGSKPIPLREPDRWTIRFINSQISDARLWEMQAEKGWVYLDPEDLAVSPGDVGLRVQDGRVVRGTHGHEVLMKIPTADYQQIVRQKDQENRQATFGAAANKAAIVSAAAQLPDGGQAAEYLQRAVKTAEITDTRERVSLED